MSQYYTIASKLNNLLLDCEGGGNKAGAKVIPWEPHKHDNQVWYDDQGTGTIRSKAGNLVLEVDASNQLIVNVYQPGNPKQQWRRDGAAIRNRVDNNQVLDILEMKAEKGAKVGAWAHNGGPNQSWQFENVGGQAPAAAGMTTPRHCYIVSEMNGKVIDIQGNNANAGAKICMYHKNTQQSKNQLWYMDGSGLIRSALNDLSFGNSGKGEPLKTQNPTDGRSQWRVEGQVIKNGVGEVLDIRGQSNSDGAEICSYDFKDQKNQKWHVEYV